MPPWFSPLFFLFARSNEEQLRRQILFLKAELEMMRARVPQNRIFLRDDERQRLLELGDGIGADVLKIISIVHPRSYRRWLERRSQGKQPAKKMGRKGTSETIRQIVVRLAKQNQWGYGRIVGELRKLRIRCVGRTTVRTILKEEGIHPGPKRGPGTWNDFVRRPRGYETISNRPRNCSVLGKTRGKPALASSESLSNPIKDCQVFRYRRP